jgi:hypothetical protein
MTEWTQCVLDASIEPIGDRFIFCPIEGDVNSAYTIIKEVRYITKEPPKHLELVAVTHPDGEKAIKKFGQRHALLIEALFERERTDK